jgi:hypothetical protein
VRDRHHPIEGGVERAVTENAGHRLTRPPFLLKLGFVFRAADAVNHFERALNLMSQGWCPHVISLTSVVAHLAVGKLSKSVSYL